MEGVPSMKGSIKGFITIVKMVNFIKSTKSTKSTKVPKELQLFSQLCNAFSTF